MQIHEFTIPPGKPVDVFNGVYPKLTKKHYRLIMGQSSCHPVIVQICPTMPDVVLVSRIESFWGGLYAKHFVCFDRNRLSITLRKMMIKQIRDLLGTHTIRFWEISPAFTAIVSHTPSASSFNEQLSFLNDDLRLFMPRLKKCLEALSQMPIKHPVLDDEWVQPTI